MPSEQQQIADALDAAIGSDVLTRGTGHRLVAAVEPFLVGAERAGYERCKRDASAALEALEAAAYDLANPEFDCGNALAVVAALDATQPGEGGA